MSLFSLSLIKVANSVDYFDQERCPYAQAFENNWYYNPSSGYGFG